jgi:hypothetical protein
LLESNLLLHPLVFQRKWNSILPMPLLILQLPFKFSDCCDNFFDD